MFRLPFIHFSCVEDEEEQGLYFHLVLLIKARSNIFQHNINEYISKPKLQKMETKEY